MPLEGMLQGATQAWVSLVLLSLALGKCLHSEGPMLPSVKGWPRLCLGVRAPHASPPVPTNHSSP